MRIKSFNSKIISRKEIIRIAILSIFFLILLLLESKNNSHTQLANEIQNSINNEYKNIIASGDVFVYHKKKLISWSNNDIPIPITYSKNLENDIVKLSNGFYLLKNEKKNDSIILYISLIKKEYTLENNYLSNTFNTNFNLKGKEEIKITYKKTDYSLKLKNNTFAYLDFSNYNKEPNSFISYIISILYFLIIFFFSRVIFLKIINKKKLNFYIKFLLIFLFYIIFYTLLYYSNISSYFYNSDFFSNIANKTIFISSEADLFIIQILLLLLISNINFNHFGRTFKYIQVFLLIPFLWFYSYLIEFLLQSTQNIISLAEIIKFNIPTIFLILQMLLASYSIYLFLKGVLLEMNENTNQNKFDYIILFITALMSSMIFINIFSLSSLIVISISLFILFIGIKNELIIKNKLSSVLYIILLLVLFSIINGLIIYNNNHQKEKIYIEHALINISKDEDKNAEKILLQIEKSFLNNTKIQTRLKNESYQKIEQYISNTYLKELNKTYSSEILICYADEFLYIHPNKNLINSKKYIDSRIANSSPLKNSHSIFKENKGLLGKAYLAYFEIKQGKRTKLIFIDCVRKKQSKEMGYPDLLINEQAKKDTQKVDLNYYGIYQNDKLVLQVGNYNYPSVFKQQTKIWQKVNGYYHYVIKNENNNTIWIASLKEQSLSDKLSLPSYLFLLSSIFLVLIQIFINPRRFLSYKQLTLSNSLQITLIIIFATSFVVFGSMSIKYFNKLTDNTNKDILVEKTQSICYSLEDFFEDNKPKDEDIYYKLIELSNTFLTDINIFDTNGFLLNTSRPAIFSQGIISSYINPNAFEELKSTTTSLIHKEERIGNRAYRATYMPVESEEGTIGYLHIPYIIQQKKIEEKILEFVSAYINVYILWITLALILSILFSNFITQPLRQLEQRLKGLKIDQKNNKIEWSREDELGKLVHSYNSMVDKLEESTQLLKKEEREGAWREMAKQVAHDIKNPLTPMKLSIQQLQRLQNDDIVKFHHRFQELSPALIEQINTLAQIASEFSYFAKEKIDLNQITDISECIKTVLEVYENQECIEIKLINSAENNILVLGEKQQYIRIFNNLIKNAVQALYGKNDGVIAIEIKEENNECKISIMDNGYGISKENQSKIFSSQFTTKIDGSGIGLSIVKSIIELLGGRIDFVSKENQGSTFYIYLPIWKP